MLIYWEVTGEVLLQSHKVKFTRSHIYEVSHHYLTQNSLKVHVQGSTQNATNSINSTYDKQKFWRKIDVTSEVYMSRRPRKLCGSHITYIWYIQGEYKVAAAIPAWSESELQLKGNWSSGRSVTSYRR